MYLLVGNGLLARNPEQCFGKMVREFFWKKEISKIFVSAFISNTITSTSSHQIRSHHFVLINLKFPSKFPSKFHFISNFVFLKFRFKIWFQKLVGPKFKKKLWVDWDYVFDWLEIFLLFWCLGELVPMMYANWKKGEPNNDGGNHCGAISKQRVILTFLTPFDILDILVFFDTFDTFLFLFYSLSKHLDRAGKPTGVMPIVEKIWNMLLSSGSFPLQDILRDLKMRLTLT